MFVSATEFVQVSPAPLAAPEQFEFEMLDDINAGSEAAWWAGAGAGVVTGLIILAAVTS
ncbi:hypothetical protein [Deinococcus aestuarii]|uniref:hypothetical protein n=1 Tax=Deinococcus aestuarii TaxID=2774531 RepID=UPI001C0C87F9|nr:hypothetical protein [Deinococcus aestuarii]